MVRLTLVIPVATLYIPLAINAGQTCLKPLAIPRKKSMAKDGPLDLRSSAIVARLKLNDESSICWDSLIQLQSCTGELIMFFLNENSYLGHGCCQIVRAISQQCWPSIIDALGFTPEETDVLQGDCNHEASSPSPSPSPSPLPLTIKPTNVSS
ncbi:hypothetical protein CRYUN_Cryun35bG0082200 [Craigia yunnanensis]